MKNVILVVIVGLAITAGLIVAYREMSQEREMEAEGEQPVQAASHVRRATDGPPVVDLDRETQGRIGLRLAKAAPLTLVPEIRAFGRVLDPASLVTRVADLTTAGAELDVAEKEWQRLQALAGQQNASQRSLESAESAVKRARVNLEAARLRLLNEWGSAVANRPDLPHFVQALASREAVLVCLNVPAGTELPEEPRGGRILGTKEIHSREARYLGPAPATDAQSLGQGFLLEVADHPPRMSPGQAVSGFLELTGDPQRGVAVPDAAVVRWAGQTWIYVSASPTSFRRRPVRLERPVPDGWFVAAGVDPQDNLVVTGAQTLLSEEQKSEIHLVD